MWLPETVRVGISARRLVVVQSGGPRPGATASVSFHRSASAAEPWRPALAALADWLAGRGAATRPRLRIVLAGRFVRWQLLPWRAALTRPQELAAYATLRFRETHGKAVEDWQVLHAPQPPGKTVPACAVDAALLQALRGVGADSGARLVSVTPYFAAAFDRWRPMLKGKVVWFGLLEEDALSLGLLRAGDWVGLHTQRLDPERGDWRAVLPAMLARIGIPAGLDQAAPLYLAGAGAPPAPVDDLPFTWLRPRLGSLADARLALGV